MSVEEEDPARAVRTLEEGIADRLGCVRRHRRELERQVGDIERMRETLGIIRARNASVLKDDLRSFPACGVVEAGPAEEVCACGHPSDRHATNLSARPCCVVIDHSRKCDCKAFTVVAEPDGSER